MRKSNFSKKQVKLEALLNVISRYQFMLLAVVGQLYVLLLISVSAEFHGILGITHSTLINALSLVSIIVLAALALMQWTQPMSNEVPIIILIVWIMLSTQANTYCICCGGDGVHAHTSEVTGVADTLQQEGIASGATAATVVVVAANEEDDALFLVDMWHTHVKGCRRESLVFWCSMLGILLLVCSLFADLRYYYLALLNRVVAIVLIFVLLVLLIVTPGSCSQFNAVDSFTVILRITFYHVLWFINQYREITELILALNYSEALQIALALLAQQPTAQQKNNKKKKNDPHRKHAISEIPAVVLQELDSITVRLRKHLLNHVAADPHAASKQLGVGDSDSDDESDDSDEEASAALAKKESSKITIEPVMDTADPNNHVMRLLFDLVDRHRLYYSEAWLANTLTWKHRSYNKNTYRLIGLARTLWVLVVSPYLLIAFVPLLAAWLLYHIDRNKREILQSCKYTTLLSYYYNAGQQ